MRLVWWGMHRICIDAHGSDTYKWNLNLSSIALLWRAGCIIRSAFLNDIAEAYHRAPGLSHMLLDRHFGLEVAEALPYGRNR